MLIEDAVQAAELASGIEPLEEEERPHRELPLGFDPQVRLLETVVPRVWREIRPAGRL